MTVKFIAYDIPVFNEVTGQQIKNKIKGITEQEAINKQKEVFDYKNDQDALQDFININWAWWVEIP